MGVGRWERQEEGGGPARGGDGEEAGERGSGTGDVSRNCWERRADAVVNALGGMRRRKMK